MFYESEIQRSNEYRTDTQAVVPKELNLALLLIRNLAAAFEPQRYRDMYREKLEALIQAKIAGEQTVEAPKVKQAEIVNILDALERSLRESPGLTPKPPTREQGALPAPAARVAPRRSGRK
jgi:DNA end-binding protein Ku